MYIGPESTIVKSLIAKKAEYDDVLAKSKQIKEKRDVLLNQYNNISAEDLARLDKVIPETFDPISSVNNINAIALGNGVSIKNFKVNTNSNKTVERGLPADRPSPTAITGLAGQITAQPQATIEAQSGSYKTNTITLEVSGNYKSFERFLLELESSLGLVDVTGLTITPESSGQTGDGFKYSLAISTYSLK